MMKMMLCVVGVGTFSQLFGAAEVGSSGGGSGGSAGSAAVPGSNANNDIEVIGGNPLDKSFLNALYAGGKVTPAQRDAILTGSDPSGFGLSAYDLYYLTVGRLGSRTAAAAVKVVATYSDTTSYAVGDIVLYRASGTNGDGLYQCIVAPPVATQPANTTYWRVLVPGPVAPIVDQDILNPAAAAVAAAGAGILSQGNNNGTALTPISIPAGRRYRITVSEIRAVNAGTSLPTDCHFRVQVLTSEQLNTDGSVQLTLTPRWDQIATANNAAIAALTANTFACRLTVYLQ